MIISHSKKFIFFRVAKTGSTAGEFLLRMSGAFDLTTDSFTQQHWARLPAINPTWPSGVSVNWAHATPQQLIDHGVLTIQQLREYACYAFLRPMEDRFVSSCLHGMKAGNWGRLDSMGLKPEAFMKRWRRMDNLVIKGRSIVGRPQVDWFFVGDEQVVTPLNFTNYDDELKKVLASVSGHVFGEIPRLNANNSLPQNREEWMRGVWDQYPEVRDDINTRYAADKQFYEDNFNT